MGESIFPSGTCERDSELAWPGKKRRRPRKAPGPVCHFPAGGICVHSQVEVAPIDLKYCVYVGGRLGSLQESRTNLRLQAGKL